MDFLIPFPFITSLSGGGVGKSMQRINFRREAAIFQPSSFHRVWKEEEIPSPYHKIFTPSKDEAETMELWNIFTTINSGLQI